MTDSLGTESRFDVQSDKVTGYATFLLFLLLLLLLLLL